MNSFPCFTHFIHNVPACVHPNRHIDGEPHLAQRFNIVTGEYEETDRPCKGCLPRRAEYGLLCWSCWEKLEDALDEAVSMITHLRSVERAVQTDNAGVRTPSGWVIPVPATWRMADELLMLLGHDAPGLPADASYFEVEAIAERTVDRIHPGSWVTLEAGAEAAIRFTLLMQQAIAHHPRKEDEHKIQLIRCERCKQRTLLWKPPLAFFPTDDNPDGRVRIVCTNEKCKHEISREKFRSLALVVEGGLDKRRQRTLRVAALPSTVLGVACEGGEHGTCTIVNCRCDCHLEQSATIAEAAS